jgi:hypothetical protein
MMLIIPISAFIGFILFFIKNKVSALTAPFLAICTLIIIQYGFAFFNLLYLAKYLIVTLGLYFIITSCVAVLRNKNVISRNSILAGSKYLLYALPFFVLLHAISDDYLLTVWDEFSFWGPSIKYMYQTNSLYVHASEDVINIRNYPPAQQLFQYFFLQFTAWSEPLLLKSKIVLVLCTLLAIFNVKAKYALFGSIAFLAGAILMYYFHYQYQNIYVDAFLAFIFAATTVLILSSKNTTIDNVAIGLSLCVLVLTKPPGLIFALLLIPAILIKSIASQLKWENRSLIFSPIFLVNNAEKNSHPYSIAAVLSHIGIILFTFASWSILLKSNGTSSNPALPSLIKYFENPLASKLISATHLFLIRLNEVCFTLPIKLYQVIAILGLLSFGLSLIGAQGSRKIRDALIFSTLPVACILYLLFLLFSYITFFSPFEGTQLYGIERYSATFLIGWTLIILGNAVGNYMDSRTIRYVVLSISLLILFVAPPKDVYKLVTQFPINADELETRHRINELAKMIDKLPSESKLYFISQGSNGYHGRVFQFSILPRRGSVGKCSSFGLPYHSDDIYTCNKNLSIEIGNYDYLIINYGDKQFWDIAEKLLTNDSFKKESGIYKIVKSKDGIKLTEHF